MQHFPDPENFGGMCYQTVHITIFRTVPSLEFRTLDQVSRKRTSIFFSLPSLTLCYTAPLPYPGHHSPSSLHSLPPKFLLIPRPRSPSGHRQIRRYEPKRHEQRPIHPHTLWCRYQRQGEIDQAFSRVVRTDKQSKDGMIGQRIIFQRRKVGVAVMLDAGGENEERDGDDCAEGWSRPGYCCTQIGNP